MSLAVRRCRFLWHFCHSLSQFSRAAALPVMLLCPPLSCPQSCVHQTGTLSSLYLRESKSIERDSVLAIILAITFAHRADRQIRRCRLQTVKFADRECRLSNSTIWSADCSNSMIWLADRQIRRFGVQTVTFDDLECPPSNSMIGSADLQLAMVFDSRKLLIDMLQKTRYPW